MSDTKGRPVTHKEVIANVRKWRVEHGLERPEPSRRNHPNRKINTMASAFQRNGVAS